MIISNVKIKIALKVPHGNISEPSNRLGINAAKIGVDYFCPDCNGVLRAKKGEKNAHHFFHLAGSTCEHQGESYIHILTKEVISNEAVVWLPDINVFFRYLPPVILENGGFAFISSDDLRSNPELDFGTFYTVSDRENCTLADISTISQFISNKYGNFRLQPVASNSIGHLQLEHKFKYQLKSATNIREEYFMGGVSIRPDLILSIEEIDILLEIKNTHSVDIRKVNKIEKNHLFAVEIDISGVEITGDYEQDYQTIKALVIKPNDITRWINHPFSKKLVDYFHRQLDTNCAAEKLQLESELAERKKAENLARQEREKREQERIAEAVMREALLKSQRSEFDQIQKSEESEGLLRITDAVSIKQLKYAVAIRRARIDMFGKNDIVVKNLRTAKGWINIHGQHLCQEPSKLVSEIKKWRKEEAQKLTYDILWNTPEDISCPKCKRICYRLEQTHFGDDGWLRKCHYCNIFERKNK